MWIICFIGGKPITPTGDSQTFANGGAQQLNGHTAENGTTVVDGAIKSEVSAYIWLDKFWIQTCSMIYNSAFFFSSNFWTGVAVASHS